MSSREYQVVLRQPYPVQLSILDSRAKRKVVRAGRRAGKTVTMAIMATKAFLDGRRILYGTPTSDQLEKFWFEVKRALREPIDGKIYAKNETLHTIEREGTENRIRAKTCWNADTLRGDYGDILILDEFQLMNEDTWSVVGAPMMLDTDGQACLVYTPPSLRSTGMSKARDPRHAAKLFKTAQADTSGRWQAFHFTSFDNPTLSQEALSEIAKDMSSAAYRQEILAEDDDIQASWLVYNAFDEGSHRVRRFEIPKTWPVYSGHDFGSANPGALFIAQNPGPMEPGTSTGGQVRKGDFVIFREYCPGAGLSTAQHVERFNDILDGHTIARSVGGNVTTEDEIRQGYGAHGWRIMPPKYARVNTQIDRVIGLMELGKLHIFDDLHHLLAQIANCLWVIDESNQPTNKVKDEAKYHLLAALRYIGSDFAQESVIPESGIIKVQSIRPGS